MAEFSRSAVRKNNGVITKKLNFVQQQNMFNFKTSADAVLEISLDEHKFTVNAADIVRHGVYRTRVRIEDRDYVGLTNVGRCPTFGERAVHAETFIIGFSGDAYGSDVSIAFLEYLREERSFASAEELGAEIKRNIEAVAGSGHGTEK